MFTQRQQLLLPPMLLLLLLSALLHSIATNSVGAQAHGEGMARIQACGTALNSILYGFCKGKFAGLMTKKRAALDLFDNAEQQQQPLLNILDDGPLPYRWPLMPGAAAEGSLLATRRLHRGVVDECCNKPCTMQEMKFYCLD